MIRHHLLDISMPKWYSFDIPKWHISLGWHLSGRRNSNGWNRISTAHSNENEGFSVAEEVGKPEREDQALTAETDRNQKNTEG